MNSWLLFPSSCLTERIREIREIFFSWGMESARELIYLSKMRTARAKVYFLKFIRPQILLIIFMHLILSTLSTASKFIFESFLDSSYIYFFTSSILIDYFFSENMFIWGVGSVSRTSSSLHLLARAEFSNLMPMDFFNLFLFVEFTFFFWLLLLLLLLVLLFIILYGALW